MNHVTAPKMTMPFLHDLRGFFRCNNANNNAINDANNNANNEANNNANNYAYNDAYDNAYNNANYNTKMQLITMFHCDCSLTYYS